MLKAHGWLPQLQPVGPAYGVGGPNTRQDFALSTAWNRKSLSIVPALAHASELEAAQQRIAALEGQLAEAQKSAPTAAELAALAAIRSVGVALKAAEAGAQS